MFNKQLLFIMSSKVSDSYLINAYLKTLVQSESPTSFEKVVDTSFEKKKFLLIFSMN